MLSEKIQRLLKRTHLKDQCKETERSNNNNKEIHDQSMPLAGIPLNLLPSALISHCS